MIQKTLYIALLMGFIGTLSHALDYPHNAINSISCTTCHHMTSGNPALLEYWTGQYVQLNSDDTPFNHLCYSCHEDITADFVRTHSSLTTDEGYGIWAIECRTCHDPHKQRQIWGYGSDSYIHSGTVGSVTVSTLTESGAGWTVDQYAGYVLIPNILEESYGYKITGNTADTLTVGGPVDQNYVTTGDTFAIIYGKLIRDTVATPLSGYRAVKLFNSMGANSLSDGDAILDGICEVCHTMTVCYRNDGTGDYNHQQGVRCVQCHEHLIGFKGSGGGAHTAHLTKITCVTGNWGCHGTNDPLTSTPIVFADGLELSATTKCDNCHASGTASAKGYWPEAGTLNGWQSVEGDSGYCGSCHNPTSPGNTEMNGGGDWAQDVVGNDSTYGYRITGHGRETASGNYARLSWQDTLAAGNPPANLRCDDCHDLAGQHFNHPTKRLKPGFENDAGNSNCTQCHDPGTDATGAPQWYTTYIEYQNSAHGTTKCTDCHDVHGAAGYPGMTKGHQEALCYQCHTQGMVQNDALSNNRPGGYVSADDIQEAFSKTRRHDLGSPFSAAGSTYTLECISCHNVHIVTGKYWEAEQGKSPITRFVNNLVVWGDDPGEKMDDYAAQGAGTGGFYYKTAQGYSLGATGLPFDRPAVYRPPKSGSGYESEYEGDVLPDYTTFCQDCHQYDMGGNSQGAVNWGSDPYKHGLSAGNMSAYITDEGTPGFWGSSGNPDVLFHMNYVTRGRHTGHFMRWPYDSADRSAGINFVLSCTDCHEAHGSERGGFIRERLNVTANGDCGTGGDPDPNGENCRDGGNWNGFCNICHYYFGGGHVGMSCGSAAACHPHQGQNSIHRGAGTGSGGTQLMLTAAGYEGDYVRPDFTPDIDTVTGNIGSDALNVTFKRGAYANSDLTGALEPNDFWLFDKNGDNPRTIVSVSHTPGDTEATVTMSAPIIEADLSMDTLATKGKSAWCWYEGGYVNAATGTIPAQAVSSGPWPVVIQTPFSISSVSGFVSGNKLNVNFSERTWGNPDRTGDLGGADFVLTDAGGDNPRTITGVDHTAGSLSAIITMSAPLVAADMNTDTLAVAGYSVYGRDGYPMGTSGVAIAPMPTPVISKAEGFAGGDRILVTFSSSVYANPDQTGSLAPGDLVLTDTGGNNARSISGVFHVAGSRFSVVTMSVPLAAADIDADTLAAAASSIFGYVGDPLGTGPVIITAQVSPSIMIAEGAVGFDKLTVAFSEGVYANPDQSGELLPGDFDLVDIDDGRTILSVDHEAGGSTAILTLSAPLDGAGDIGADTLAAAAGAIYNSSSNAAGTVPVTLSGYDCPAWGTLFEFSEGAGSATTGDDTGLLTGSVGNPSFSMRGDGYYWGDETEAQPSYIDLNVNDKCLNNPRSFTLETRIFLAETDLDYTDSDSNGYDDDFDAGGPFSTAGDGRNYTGLRVAERQATFQFIIFRANYAGDFVSSRAGRARVILKYRTDNSVRHTCPHPQWPDDPYAGNDVAMHQISTSIDAYPLVNNHWYRIKIVFNSDKYNIPGSNGTPVDIFMDDEGTDGFGTGELWPGYRNASRTINESSSCRWGALPGDFVMSSDRFSAIGDDLTHTDLPGDQNNLQLRGRLDWFFWKPVADYTGVDDLPR